MTYNNYIDAKDQADDSELFVLFHVPDNSTNKKNGDHCDFEHYEHRPASEAAYKPQ